MTNQRPFVTVLRAGRRKRFTGWTWLCGKWTRSRRTTRAEGAVMFSRSLASWILHIAVSKHSLRKVTPLKTVILWGSPPGLGCFIQNWLKFDLILWNCIFPSKNRGDEVVLCLIWTLCVPEFLYINSPSTIHTGFICRDTLRVRFYIYWHIILLFTLLDSLDVAIVVVHIIELHYGDVIGACRANNLSCGMVWVN